MSKPFQFSMRRMFVLITVFCIELGLFAAFKKFLPTGDAKSTAEGVRAVCVIA